MNQDLEIPHDHSHVVEDKLSHLASKSAFHHNEGVFVPAGPRVVALLLCKQLLLAF